MKVSFFSIKTEKIEVGASGRTLKHFLYDYVLWKIGEWDVLFVSSKIVSLFQGRVKKFRNSIEKEDFSRWFWFWSWKRKDNSNYPLLVVQEGGILAFWWIDDSNIPCGFSVLPPENPFWVAQDTLKYLKEKMEIKDLALVITDSNSRILRKGSTGIAIAWSGCIPLKNYRWQEDLFGRKLQYTSQNIVDALASTAVFLMGEWNEQTPIVVMQWATWKIEFTQNDSDKNDLFLPRQEDMFCDMIDSLVWENLP